MHFFLSSIKDDLNDMYYNLKSSNLKGVPFDMLISFFKGESLLFSRKLPMMLNQSYKEVIEKMDVSNLVQVGERLKNVYLPSKVNKNLSLRFLNYLHFARNEITDIDFAKEVSSNYSEFERFYQHVRRKRKDEANTKLQVMCSYFQYQVRKYFFKDEKRKWRKIDFKDNIDQDLMVKDVRSSSANIFGTSMSLVAPSIFRSIVRLLLIISVTDGFRSLFRNLIRTRDCTWECL